MIKKIINSHGRIVYTEGHSTSCGGNVYIHETLEGGLIQDKPRLKSILDQIALRLELVDPTVKVYDRIFFFFFHIPKTLAPLKIVDSIKQDLNPLGEWDKEHLFDGVYDLQERYVRDYLAQWRFDYDQG